MLLILIPAHAMAVVMHAFRVEKQHIVESESRFRSALEYSAIGMALVSPQGKWLQVNQALCALLGYTPEALHKLTFQEITHPDDLTADLSQLHDLLDGHISSYTMEKRYIRSDGQTVWALLAVSLVRDAEGLPLYFISQVEDISDLKRSQAENNRLVERITLANQVGGVGIWEWVMSGKTSPGISACSNSTISIPTKRRRWRCGARCWCRKIATAPIASWPRCWPTPSLSSWNTAS